MTRLSRKSAQTQTPPRRGGESGYALMFALFLILAILAAASVAVISGKTRGQRQREEEMIFRGEQYKRAIRLYFHKTGHYPQTMDDLEKGLPDLHFLRKAYKDPMNTGDGAWRYIYVNPAGQIIGSVRYANLQQMALLDMPGGPNNGTQGIPGLGTPASQLNQNQSSVVAFSQITGPTTGSGGGASTGPGGINSGGGAGLGGIGTGTSDGSGLNPPNPNDPNAPQNQQNQNQQNQSQPNPQGQNQQPQSGFGQSPQPGGGLGFGSSFGSTGQQGSIFGTFGQSSSSGQGSNGSGNANPLLDMKPTGPVDGPVLGAFLTGVASKVDKKSFKVYHSGKKYNEWEFIWNPLEDQAAAAAAIGQQAGVPGTTLPFANPGIFGNGPQGGQNPGGANGTQPNNGSNPGGQPQPQPQPMPQGTSPN